MDTVDASMEQHDVTTFSIHLHSLSWRLGVLEELLSPVQNESNMSCVHSDIWPNESPRQDLAYIALSIELACIKVWHNVCFVVTDASAQSCHHL
jgi:hypothetical protein